MHAGSGATRVHMRWSRCKRPLRTPPCGVEEPLLHEHHTPGTRRLTPPPPKNVFRRHRRGSALPRPHICEPPRRCRAAAAAGRPGGRCRRGAIGLRKPCDRGLTGFLHLDTAWNRRRRFRPPFHPPLKRRGRFQRARSRWRGGTGKCRTGGTNLNVPQAPSALWPKTLFGPISILSVAVKICE